MPSSFSRSILKQIPKMLTFYSLLFLVLVLGFLTVFNFYDKSENQSKNLAQKETFSKNNSSVFTSENLSLKPLIADFEHEVVVLPECDLAVRFPKTYESDNWIKPVRIEKTKQESQIWDYSITFAENQAKTKDSFASKTVSCADISQKEEVYETYETTEQKNVFQNSKEVELNKEDFCEIYGLKSCQIQNQRAWQKEIVGFFETEKKIYQVSYFNNNLPVEMQFDSLVPSKPSLSLEEKLVEKLEFDTNGNIFLPECGLKIRFHPDYLIEKKASELSFVQKPGGWLQPKFTVACSDDDKLFTEAKEKDLPESDYWFNKKTIDKISFFPELENLQIYLRRNNSGTGYAFMSEVYDFQARGKYYQLSFTTAGQNRQKEVENKAENLISPLFPHFSDLNLEFTAFDSTKTSIQPPVADFEREIATQELSKEEIVQAILSGKKERFDGINCLLYHKKDNYKEVKFEQEKVFSPKLNKTYFKIGMHSTACDGTGGRTWYIFEQEKGERLQKITSAFTQGLSIFLSPEGDKLAVDYFLHGSTCSGSHGEGRVEIYNLENKQKIWDSKETIKTDLKLTVSRQHVDKWLNNEQIQYREKVVVLTGNLEKDRPLCQEFYDSQKENDIKADLKIANLQDL